MWVQKLQRSKTLKVFLVLVVLLASFTASTTKAVGLDTAVKIVAGSSAQKVVRSIGEKAGMQFSQKSLNATTDYINAQASKGNVHYIDFAKKANAAAAAGTPSTTKPGWKKYLLDPVMWLTGADLLVEAYDAFTDAQATGGQVDTYGQTYQTYGFTIKEEMGVLHIYHVSQTDYIGTTYLNSSFTSPYKFVNMRPTTSTATSQKYDFDLEGTNKTTGQRGKMESNSVTLYGNDLTKYGDESYSLRPVDPDDDADISNMTTYNTYKNTIDNDDYSRVTYNNTIEIEAPDTDTVENNDYSDSWNPKMSDEDFNIIVKPITDIDIVVPPDDDDLPTGPRPDPVEVIDRSMLDVARQSYDYLGDSVDTAISSMRDVTDNVTGLIAFLDDTFDWLPAEWRALFGSAFILGVFAHFFRR